LTSSLHFFPTPSSSPRRFPVHLLPSPAFASCHSVALHLRFSHFGSDLPSSDFSVDIVETKGNMPSSNSEAASNVVKEALHWGPSYDTDAYTKTRGEFRSTSSVPFLPFLLSKLTSFPFPVPACSETNLHQPTIHHVRNGLVTQRHRHLDFPPLSRRIVGQVQQAFLEAWELRWLDGQRNFGGEPLGGKRQP
jgi:hypothetical protein